jgi:hypothetical protein
MGRRVVTADADRRPLRHHSKIDAVVVGTRTDLVVEGVGYRTPARITAPATVIAG